MITWSLHLPGAGDAFINQKNDYRQWNDRPWHGMVAGLQVLRPPCSDGPWRGDDSVPDTEWELPLSPLGGEHLGWPRSSAMFRAWSWDSYLKVKRLELEMTLSIQPPRWTWRADGTSVRMRKKCSFIWDTWSASRHWPPNRTPQPWLIPSM